MKHFKIILSIAIAIFSFTAVNAQVNKANTNKVNTDKAVYQCPMKCEGEKTYTKEGKCPVCNMNLKAMSKPVASVKYQCPMKCEGEKTYAKAGKCPACNMNLKALSKPPAVVYQCSMKCEGEKTYAKEGKCPMCNMKLAKLKAKKETKGHEGHNHN